jgi:hypothetical protein
MSNDVCGTYCQRVITHTCASCWFFATTIILVSVVRIMKIVYFIGLEAMERFPLDEVLAELQALGDFQSVQIKNLIQTESFAAYCGHPVVFPVAFIVLEDTLDSVVEIAKV